MPAMVYNVGMMKTYTLTDPKPEFKDGETVLVDGRVLGLGNDAGIEVGTIVGKGSEHIIDMWLVRFNRNFAPTYPFKVVSVIHTAIIKNMPVDKFLETLKK